MQLLARRFTPLQISPSFWGSGTLSKTLESLAPESIMHMCDCVQARQKGRKVFPGSLTFGGSAIAQEIYLLKLCLTAKLSDYLSLAYVSRQLFCDDFSTI